MIENVEFKNGFHEVEIKSWNSLIELISQLSHTLSLAYRGEETLEYKLKSTFHREYTKSFMEDDFDILGKHLENFKNEIRGRTEMFDKYKNSNDEMWAIGQHHGLATPLLDWTYSSYVALYFAFHKKTSQDNAVLYVVNLDALEYDFLIEIQKHTRLIPSTIRKDLMNISTINHIENGKPSFAQTILDVYNKKLDAPLETESFCIDIVSIVLNTCIKTVLPKSGENQRLINQRGLFTLTKDWGTISELIQRRFKGTSSKVLMKIKIDASLKINLLNQLSAMNINHSTLFPDLGGAAVFCNHKLFDSTTTKFKPIELPPSENTYTLKDIKILTDLVYTNLLDNSDYDFYKNLPLNEKLNFIPDRLEGITYGEYIYALYCVFRTILSDLSSDNLELYHHSIFYALLMQTKDLFLDDANDDNNLSEKEDSFLNMYYAFTKHESIRYEYDETNDEMKYQTVPNTSEISYDEWEDAWGEVINYAIETYLIDDDFVSYQHFTHMHTQPYIPTESEYRIAYEWFKGINDEDRDKSNYKSNRFLYHK